jgi:hypothetical protein
MAQVPPQSQAPHSQPQQLMPGYPQQQATSQAHGPQQGT